jgi:Viral BACON domain
MKWLAAFVLLFVTTYPFVLKSTPTSLTFSSANGAVPAKQTVSIFDSSTCGTDPVCTFATTVKTDSTWLTVTPASGTTEFNITVTATPGTMAAGTYTGHVIATAALLTTPTLSIPVTLTITSPHKVSLSWNAQSGVTFNVLRSTGYPGTFTQIGTSTTPSYTDTSVTANGTYCYEIQSVSSGVVSATGQPVACFLVP